MSGLGGRWIQSVLLLAALSVASETHAEERGVALVFDASAEGLAQAEVRAAVERELGHPLATSGDGTSDELTVLVDQGRLVVRFRSPTGASERYLPMPSEPSDLPLIVSLAAGNLVRDQSAGFAAAESPESAKNAALAAPAAAQTEGTPPPPPPAKKEPEFRRHRLGFHVAQDIPYVHDLNPCGDTTPTTSGTCYYANTRDDPFFHDVQANHDYVEGFSFGTTRLLLAYEFFVIPALSVGARTGFAFGGGPPAGQGPTEEPPGGDPNLLRPHADGTGGQSFLPVHAELRASYWYLSPAKRAFGAYVGAGFGVAQVDAKHKVVITDCAQTLESSWDPADGSFDDCMTRSSDLNASALETTELDYWSKMGRGFVTATAGATLSLTSEFSAILNLNAMFTFPDNGFVLEPSLGGMFAF